jgi:hypothetical protein
MILRKIANHRCTHKILRVLGIGLVAVAITEFFHLNEMLEHVNRTTEFFLGSLIEHAIFGE